VTTASTAGVGGCTVATRSYLADARLAARSFVEHHPGARFTILVVDGDHMAPATWAHRDVDLVTPAALGFDADELTVMATIYDPAELACALKPLALRRVLDQTDIAVYIDGDVEILAPMPDLVDAGRRHDVVLVPHVLDPVPRDGLLPDEPGLLGAGMYNGGLIACGDGSASFLDWWQRRLRRDCIHDLARMLHGDQRWLDFVPALFDHHILRDPTYDVAYWNLHERPTAWVDGRLCVVDEPVRCFHYSGLTDARPWVLSYFAGDHPRARLADLPAVARQCRGWLARRRAVDAEGDRALGYHWARTAQGVPLDRRSRMAWREALLAAEADPSGRTARPPSPFAGDGGAAWEDWLRSPQGPDGLGRYLQRVWDETPAIHRSLPDPAGADRLAFLHWCTSAASDEAAIPDAFRPLPKEVNVPDPTRLVRRPPRPAASAQVPIEAVDAVRSVLDRPPASDAGPAGRVVDRLLAARDEADERSHQAAGMLADAVAELAQRVADLSDRVDRTNDGLYEQESRFDELTELDEARRLVAEDLTRRVRDAEATLERARDALEGATEQDRITAAILADSERRIYDDIDDLRRRMVKLTEGSDGTTPEAPDAPAEDPR